MLHVLLAQRHETAPYWLMKSYVVESASGTVPGALQSTVYTCHETVVLTREDSQIEQSSTITIPVGGTCTKEKEKALTECLGHGSLLLERIILR